MMKACKLSASTQEDCGVWLDTADLRRKRKPVRPISRLLNLLGPSGAYRVPAALSFTQTRLRFPATTQSSIASFLSPRRRHGDAAQPSSLPLGLSSRITQSASPAPGVPRCESETAEQVIVLSTSCPGMKEAESAEVMATPRSPPDATALQKKRKRLRGSEEPASSRAGDVVPALRALPQDSAGGEVRGGCRMLGACSFPLQVEEEDEAEEEEPAKKRLWAPNSKETPPCHLTQRDPALSHRSEGKENSQRTPLPLSSPPSPKPMPWRRESHCASPRKRPLCDLPETQVESRSQLFTQDSEGRQVMAHHGAVCRTPLLDCANFTPCSELHCTVPSQPLLQGEPDSELRPELLFTQDSMGNRVIKH